MGMGEPLSNYINLKKTINTWLKFTDLGPTKITVSTVGVLPILNKLLTDTEWPPVKIAISLHSANQQKRQEIVPSTSANFINDLAEWSKKYSQLHGNRSHHLTFEYTLINEVNDTPELAEELAKYISQSDRAKINLIPLNAVPGKPFLPSQQRRIDAFKQILLDHNLDVTQRKTMGDDIAAACGQLTVAKRDKK
jgi:23S rRNA (adenine2503-C2)-methyltransferase